MSMNLSLPIVFSDGMILQRHVPLTIWGTGGNASEVSGTLNGYTTISGVIDGHWKLEFPAMEAATGCQLEISCGKETLTISDIAIGEVWIAGGQSNMDHKLAYDPHFFDLIAQPKDALLRTYNVPALMHESQSVETAFGVGHGKWLYSEAESLGVFSAVAYHFGRKLREELDVPVGVITCSMGGTPAQAWSDEELLQDDPKLSHYWDEYIEAIKDLDMAALMENLSKGQQMIFSNSAFTEFFDEYLRGTLTIEKLKAYNDCIPGGLATVSSRNQPMTPFSSARPGGLFKTMVKTIAGYPAKGVIFYHGETDSVRHWDYADLFTLLIKSWRRAWNSPLPFVFTQIAGFDQDILGVVGENFDAIRTQQQVVAETVENTYLTTAVDCGDPANIHPADKSIVGRRLAMTALGACYQMNAPYQLPKLSHVDTDGQTVTLHFTTDAKGLYNQGGKIDGLQLFVDGDILRDWTATIEADTVKIQCKTLPDTICYGQGRYPQISLYNEHNLPVLPFTHTF